MNVRSSKSGFAEDMYVLVLICSFFMFKIISIINDDGILIFPVQTTSPKSNVEQGGRPLLPNFALKEAIGKYLKVQIVMQLYFFDHSPCEHGC